MRLWGLRIIARTVLLAYTLFVIKPVMPYVADALAHTFWRSVHIAVVHTENGKEHVHYEVSKMAADGEKDQPGKQHKTVTENTDHLAAAYAGAAPGSAISIIIEKPRGHYVPAFCSALLLRHGPPPKRA